MWKARLLNTFQELPKSGHGGRMWPPSHRLSTPAVNGNFQFRGPSKLRIGCRYAQLRGENSPNYGIDQGQSKNQGSNLNTSNWPLVARSMTSCLYTVQSFPTYKQTWSSIGTNSDAIRAAFSMMVAAEAGPYQSPTIIQTVTIYALWNWLIVQRFLALVEGKVLSDYESSLLPRCHDEEGSDIFF